MDHQLNHAGIIGAGAMGAGIAQVAITNGWTVHLSDLNEEVVRSAIEGINKRLNRLVEKGRMTDDEWRFASSHLRVSTKPDDFSDCTIIIEAVIENLEIKSKVLNNLIPALSNDTIIATNTSSLSVTELGDANGQPHRTVGMHFFNPAPLMKLVEVIAGRKTHPEVVDRVATIGESWGKQVARAADVPGFIVNHVARPYYLEAFRILEDGLATPKCIDETMKTLGGFRMGPLELTDLIGQDVNTATTRSVWQQLDQPPLLTPSRLQEQLVADGHLGRKTGRGVFLYESKKPTTGLQININPFDLSESVREAAKRFADRATNISGNELQQYVFARILVSIIAQAFLAHERGVAEKHDIDTALKYGVNYPRGPFEWAEQIGLDLCAELLNQLNNSVSDSRFEIPWLMHTAITNR